MDIDDFDAQFATELDLLKEVNDLEITNSRIKRRLSFDESENKPNNSSATHHDEGPKAKRPRVMSRPSVVPPSGPHISITGFNGRRVFVEVDPPVAYTPPSRPSSGGLLSLPISFLMDSLSSLHHSHDSTDSSRSSDHASLHDDPTSKEHKLWVDKYAPATFQDLLSDERTNRNVLAWLKQWDPIVFGKPSPIAASESPQAKRSPFPRKTSKPNPNPSSHSSTGPEGPTNPENSFHKAILLCGPPGLGKTTLAHVLARHAGYNPVEINASDDRTEGMFEKKLIAAVEMQSVMGSRKPNCLIVDEIDGIEDNESKGGVVDVLLNVLAAKKKEGQGRQGQERDDEDTGDRGVPSEPSSGKRRRASLQRPIICICNDVYAPSLRRLRNAVQVFHFTKPATARLVGRLREICKNEGLVADTHTLTALVELTEHDIRSCIHTLQFLRARSSLLTPLLLASSHVGQKDINKGLFEVWREIFIKGDSNMKIVDELRRRSAVNMSVHESLLGHPTTTQQTSPLFDRLFNTISACGQTDRILDGCFENYLSIVSSDHMMDKTLACVEWMLFSSDLNFFIRKNQLYELSKYLNAVPIAFQCKAAITATPTLSYPKTDHQSYTTLTRNKNILQSYLLCLPPHIRSPLNIPILASDVISPFVDILAPMLRPINPLLLNENERASMTNLVAIMALYHISFILDKSDTPSNFMKNRLEPALDVMTHFTYPPLSPGSRHLVLSPQLCEIINSKVMEHSTRGGSTPIVHNIKKPKIEKSEDKEGIPKVVVVKRPTPATATEAKDFFGRVVQKAITEEGQTTTNSRVKGPNTPSAGGTVRYRYHEGFTNAVRRTVYVKDFL